MKKKWWKEAVVYQVYPRSFMDSDGDGIGDIKGLISKLDYLKMLGINVIWLSPVFVSPHADNGYDISNYCDIDPQFGTMEDINLLIEEMHKRDIKLLMDLIVNHTSDEHPWFVEAKKSKDNPYHNYYIWKDGEEGTLPNNWKSHFSGPVWKYEKNLAQYYLHIFAEKQPDLNWENPKVREEVANICRFWLDKGIDGFRMDVINFISKVPGLPSVSGATGLVSGKQFYMNGPHIHEYLQELYQNVLSKYDIMTVGETHNVTTKTALDYVGEERGELNMVFGFEHMSVDSADGDKWQITPWKLKNLKGILSKWQTAFNGRGWNSSYLCNHDQPRSLSRFGDVKHYPQESAKLLATMIHTMQGTPYVYQGEEIGMTNVEYSDISYYRDIQTLNLYRDLKANGVDEEDIMRKLHYRSRDNARTPMQWEDKRQAGFTAGTPWIDVNPNYTHVNVEQQVSDKNSIFYYYQRLIALRKETPVVVYGDFHEYDSENLNLYAYSRQYEEQTLYVALNFSKEDLIIAVPNSIDICSCSIYIGNYDCVEIRRTMILRPYEAISLLEQH